jgi:hypothetical protein
MEDESVFGKIIGLTGKVVLGMLAVGTAAAVATAYYAGKAGQGTREKLDETVSQVREKAQDAMGPLTGPAPSPTP